MAGQDVVEFVQAQRDKRAARGDDPQITDDGLYRLVEGLLAGRRSTEAGGRRV